MDFWWVHILVKLTGLCDQAPLYASPKIWYQRADSTPGEVSCAPRWQSPGVCEWVCKSHSFVAEQAGLYSQVYQAQCLIPFVLFLINN